LDGHIQCLKRLSCDGDPQRVEGREYVSGFEETVNREGAKGVVRDDEGKEEGIGGVVGRSTKENARAMSNKNRRETFSGQMLRLL
jgi:hypothetical protein